jgi:O-antigen/teichoic acid export membrane protein
MLTKLKYLLKHSSIYTIATMLQKLTGFLLLTFLTDTTVVSVREFSAYNYFIMDMLILSAIMSLGMEGAMIRLIKLKEERKKDILKSAVNTLLISTVIGAVLIFIFRNPIATYAFNDSDMFQLAGLMGLVLIFDMLSNLPQYYFRASERPVMFTLIRIMRFVLEFSGIYYGLYHMDIGILGAGYGLLAASIVQFLVMLPFYRNFYSIHIDKPLVKEMLKFGIPLIPNTILYLFIEMTDRYLLEYFIGKETQATYTNIYKFAAILTIINSSFRAAFQPIMLREAKDKNKEYFKIVLRYFTIFIAFVMIITSLLAVDTIRYNPFEIVRNLIRDPIYYTQAHVLSMLLMGYIFLGIYYNFSIAYYYKNKSYILMRLTFLGFIVNVGINMWMLKYPESATSIAAFATMMAFFTMAALSYWQTRKIYPVDYQIGKIIKILFYAGIVVFISVNNIVENYALKLLIALGFIPYLLLIRGITISELKNIKQLVRTQ